MSTNTVDWSTLTTDPAAAPPSPPSGRSRPASTRRCRRCSSRSGSRPASPPSRCPMSGDHLGDLLDVLTQVHGIVQRLRDRSFRTDADGHGQGEAAKLKQKVEAAAVRAPPSDDLTALAGALTKPAASSSNSRSSPGHRAQQTQLVKALPALREGISAARAALGGAALGLPARALHAPTSRSTVAAIEARLRRSGPKVEPALRLVADLEISGPGRGRPRDSAARRMAARCDRTCRAAGHRGPRTRTPGRSSTSAATAAALPPVRRIAISDGTTADALGAARVVPSSGRSWSPPPRPPS